MFLLALLAVLVLAALWTGALVLEWPLWPAVFATFVAVLGAALLWIWRRLRARRAAGEIERSLQSQADAQAATVRPDQQAEIDALQAEFQKAVAALKTSKLARGGRDALAVLPWYVIIGPPGAGKSTALRNSGLQFPYLSARGGGVKGVGGTRNCEWWLTNEAVILDTAGRYSTEDEDHDEWSAFLDMLHRTRPRKPVNGLLVAVSVGDLGGETEDGVVALAERLRARIDEVMSRLQVVLPAYLVFTKCDLVPGFVESFSDLRKQDRGQIWGFTASPADRTPPGELFRERFRELVSVLEERALERIGEERGLAARERIWQFPQQVSALEGNLALLVETLFAGNVYQDTPILRGVYFTSGTQEGRTLDRVMGAMADAFGLRPQLGAEAPALDAKSYFLRDVFQKVVFPDQHLAVKNAKAVRRQSFRLWGLAAAAGIAALLLFSLPVQAYVRNRSLVRSTGALAAQAAAALADDKAALQLATLDPLRERLDQLRRWEEDGPPFSMRFGMYQGEALLPGARALFAAAARRLVIEPVYGLEAEELDAFVKQYEQSEALPDEAAYAAAYDRLKLDLILSGPKAPGEPVASEADQAWAVQRIADRWTDGATAREAAEAKKVTANAELFLQVLAEEPALGLVRYDDLVRKVRGVLSRVPYTALAAQRLIQAVAPRGLDVTLPALLGEPVSTLRGEARVRGAFTRKGYEDVVKPLLEDPSSLLEPWVLARDAKDAEERLAEATAQLRTRYFELYMGEWKRFLDGVSVDPAAAGGAMVALQELTRGEPPPLQRLFRGVAYHTRIGGFDGAASGVRQGVLDRLQKRMGAKGKVVAAAAQGGPSADRELGPNGVERAFAGLVVFAVPPDALPGAVANAVAGGKGGEPQPVARNLPMDFYQEQLVFVRDALLTAREGGDPRALTERVAAARTRIRALIETAEIGWRPRLEALLWPPINAASNATAQETAGSAARAWCTSVAGPYRQRLEGRYPFRADGDDASLSDVAEFFRPGGELWGFYDQNLKGDVPRGGDGFQFARQLGGATGFHPGLLGYLDRAQEVTQVLFSPGVAEPKVQLNARIRPTPGVAVVWLEVDGQRFDYRNGPEEWHRFAWPGEGRGMGASVRARAANGQEEVVQQEGDWGFFRLLEAGKVKGETGRDFSVTWTLPSLGAAITIDFRPDRADTPFFGSRRRGNGRFLAPFRAGLTPPAEIGKSPVCSGGAEGAP
jgi:type VI secretion system protein ImpL